MVEDRTRIRTTASADETDLRDLARHPFPQRCAVTLPDEGAERTFQLQCVANVKLMEPDCHLAASGVFIRRQIQPNETRVSERSSTEL